MPRARAWPRASVAAPAAIRASERGSAGGSKPGRVAEARRASRTKHTPPTEAACADRISPRSRTSRNPVTSGRLPPPRAPPDQEHEDRRSEGNQDQEPVGSAEAGEQDDQVDEVAIGHRLGQPRARRGGGRRAP